MLKFQCAECKSDILSFSVCSNNEVKRTDFRTGSRGGTFYKYDTEWYEKDVTEVIFKCPKCGEITVKMTEDENLDQFVRDTTGVFDENDIVAKLFGKYEENNTAKIIVIKDIT